MTEGRKKQTASQKLNRSQDRTIPNWIYEWKSDLSNQLRVFGIWVISGLLDSVFLALWGAIQWGANKFFFEQFILRGFDNIVLITLRSLLAISTLAPIAIYIYTDVRVMLVRSKTRISQEVAKGGSDV